VHDQPNIAAHPNRPESPILGFVELVKLQTRMRWVQLEIERRSLDGLLFIAGQFGEAVRERVGNSKFHQIYLALPQSPRLLAKLDDEPQTTLLAMGIGEIVENPATGCVLSVSLGIYPVIVAVLGGSMKFNDRWPRDVGASGFHSPIVIVFHYRAILWYWKWVSPIG
jgi:hypothetical protein